MPLSSGHRALTLLATKNLPYPISCATTHRASLNSGLILTRKPIFLSSQIIFRWRNWVFPRIQSPPSSWEQILIITEHETIFIPFWPILTISQPSSMPLPFPPNPSSAGRKHPPVLIPRNFEKNSSLSIELPVKLPVGGSGVLRKVHRGRNRYPEYAGSQQLFHIVRFDPTRSDYRNIHISFL